MPSPLTLCGPETPKMGTLANRKDPDEMPHDAAFHQALNCLLRQNQSSVKEIQYFLELITCGPSIYTMHHPDTTLSNFMGNSIGLKELMLQFC